MKNKIFISLIIFFTLIGFAIGDIVGLSGILLVTLITFFLAKSWPSIANILYVALLFRVLLIILGNGVISLPDSAGDAWFFELVAYEWSKLGFLNAIFNFPELSESFVISYIISILYSLTDRSIVLAQSMSLLFGLLSVFMSCILAKKLWGNPIAIKVGWFTALYPSLILYSALVMREMYICFFLLVALNNVINWTNNGSYKSFLFASLSFILAGVFHGGMYVGLIMFIVLAISFNYKKILKLLINGLITLKTLVVFALMIVFIFYVSINNITIPKIGVVTDINELKEGILKKNLVSHRGDAKYPDWTIAKSENELIYKIPIRAIYFIFSPFPWELKKSSHLIGLLDGTLYMLMAYLIFRNRKVIWSDPALRMIFLILLTYIIVYGIATGNFGTGLRHRTKFSIMFILLAAPLLPKFIFFKKIK